MAISDRITSIEEHIKESYQELEGIGIDTTGVNNNLENIPKLIDGYWETLPKVTEEGTSITLDNTKEGKMKIDLKGNTSQETSILPSGYTQVDYIYNFTNYFDTGIKLSNNSKVEMKFLCSETSTTRNKMVFGARDSANSKNFSIMCRDQVTADFNNSNYETYRSTYTYTPNTEYIVSVSKSERTIYNNARTILAQNNTLCEDTFTTTENACIGFINPLPSNTWYVGHLNIYYCRIWENNVLVRNMVPCYRNSDSVVGLYDTVNNVFYEGIGEATVTYGSTSVSLPNPDFPIPINVVRGNNTITISNSDNTQSQNYQITLGSSTNTFDVSKVLQGVYSDIPQYNSKRLTLFGELKSNGYVVNVVCNNPNLQFGILRTSMNTISSSNQNLQTSGWYPNYSSLEFNGEGYVCILIKKADDSDITINDISSNDFNISESYELCKLGDYQDYIYKTNGNWYFHKNILKVCINGENWVKQADYVFYKRFLYITDKTTKQQTYCNQFIWDGRGSGMTSLADNHFAQQATTALYVRDNRNQNLSTFEAWVNANPLITYFRLTTPTDTQITDSTLLSQLEALNGAKSYTTQTNINQDNNDNASILNASALENM